MVSFSAPATVALIAIAGLIEPTLGGFIVGAAARGIARSVAGNAASSAVQDHENKKHSRDAPAIPSIPGVPTELVNQCLSDAKAQGMKLFLNKQDHSAMLENVPESCIEAVNKYNALPNISELEKTEGKVEVVGKDALKVTGAEGEVQKLLESAGVQQPGDAPGAAQPNTSATPAAK